MPGAVHRLDRRRFPDLLADASVKRGAQTLLRGCSDRHLFVLEVCGALDLFRIDRDFVCPTVSVDAPLNVVPEAG